MLKKFRYILLPFSVMYGFIIGLRNKLFDKNILRSASFNFPVICVGNLALGGTGKTPMTEYLIRLLMQKYKVATLSRGYKRKTKGFAIADDTTTAIDIGDEPMQLHKKFPGVTVAVAEERVVGIPQLLHAKPETRVIILDDAFQHREVRPGLNILLTEYQNLYTKDMILPAGNLRDVKSSSSRAHIIVVTKCPPNLNEEEKQATIRGIKSRGSTGSFFYRNRIWNSVSFIYKGRKNAGTRIRYFTHLWHCQSKTIAGKSKLFCRRLMKYCYLRITTSLPLMILKKLKISFQK